jgi:alpha-ketoglutarate-dependent taurine dioxygenase
VTLYDRTAEETIVSLTVTRLTPNVGAEITGLSGRQLVDPDVAAEVETMLDQHGVVVIRAANVDAADLVAFSRHLGEVVVAPTGEHELPEIQTITLDPGKTDPVLAAFRRGNFFWHIDGVHDAVPQKSTFLSARQVAEEGGDTEFASTYAAHAALPDDERTRLDGLRVVHSFGAAQGRANPNASNDERARWERVPVREHPLVWTHRDGRRSMLLGVTASHVVGWSTEDSDALLMHLLEWATRPEFVLRHQWRIGDLVMWDNTGMLHRAMPFEPTSRRLLHRTTLVGTEAVA